VDKAMWNSVSVAVTVAPPPAAAADPGALAAGDEADDAEPAADEEPAVVDEDGALAAVDEPDEQAASRLTAAPATGIANQTPRRCRRPPVFVFMNDADTTPPRRP
jgi:hypothetical protein